MDQKEKDYRDARLNGYNGSYQQFVSSYFNDTGSSAAASNISNTTEQREMPREETIVREMLPREPVKLVAKSESQEETILGLKPIYFYGACAAVVVLAIAIGILVWKNMKSKKDESQVASSPVVSPIPVAPVSPSI